MYLIDTSAWILSFKKQSNFKISNRYDIDEICLVLPIYQEVLQGFRNDTDFFAAQIALDHALCIENPMPKDIFLEAAQLYRFLRKKGATIRSSLDVLIAVCAIRNRATVVHDDRDFSTIAKFTDLLEEEAK